MKKSPKNRQMNLKNRQVANSNFIEPNLQKIAKSGNPERSFQLVYISVVVLYRSLLLEGL